MKLSQSNLSTLFFKLIISFLILINDNFSHNFPATSLIKNINIKGRRKGVYFMTTVL